MFGISKKHHSESICRKYQLIFNIIYFYLVNEERLKKNKM